jgi:hypothetical protein
VARADAISTTQQSRAAARRRISLLHHPRARVLV